MVPMVTQPKVLIVGAGLIGLSTAYALQIQGVDVTIVDIRSEAMRGTSHANSAMIHPSQSRPWVLSGDESFDRAAAKAVLELARESKASLIKNFSVLNLELITSRESGCYQVFDESRQVRMAQKRYAEIGVEANVVFDHVDTLGHVALHFSEDFSGDAYEYGMRLVKYLQSNGGVFIYNASDLRLRRGKGGITAQLRGHIFHCDHVVVCAGPESTEVLSQLDIQLALQNLRGFAVDFACPDMKLPTIPVMDAHSRSALTILGNVLRLSGTMNETSAHPLLKRWFQLAPDVMAALSPAQKIWSGLRPVSPTGRPFISPTSIKGLWVNTGHGHMGWTLSAGSGELMADMILKGYSDDRFYFSG